MALHRVDAASWIRGEWSESGRQVKLYSLTLSGRLGLENEEESWKRLSVAIDLVVDSL
jgi:PadR family transcriptional regulator PadR